jgi:hypothetical protein
MISKCRATTTIQSTTNVIIMLLVVLSSSLLLSTTTISSFVLQESQPLLFNVHRYKNNNKNDPSKSYPSMTSLQLYTKFNTDKNDHSLSQLDVSSTITTKKVVPMTESSSSSFSVLSNHSILQSIRSIILATTLISIGWWCSTVSTGSIVPTQLNYIANAKEMASGSGSRVNKDPESLLRYGLPIQNKDVCLLVTLSYM